MSGIQSHQCTQPVRNGVGVARGQVVVVVVVVVVAVVVVVVVHEDVSKFNRLNTKSKAIQD